MTMLDMEATEEVAMAATCEHFRLVYTTKATGERIVSMSHQKMSKAVSMADMLNRYARKGRFTVEDEWDTISEQEKAA